MQEIYLPPPLTHTLGILVLRYDTRLIFYYSVVEYSQQIIDKNIVLEENFNFPHPISAWLCYAEDSKTPCIMQYNLVRYFCSPYPSSPRKCPQSKLFKRKRGQINIFHSRKFSKILLAVSSFEPTKTKPYKLRFQVLIAIVNDH